MNSVEVTIEVGTLGLGTDEIVLEIGTDGSDALAGLGLDFGTETGISGDAGPPSDLEAEEIPEVESPLDD